MLKVYVNWFRVQVQGVHYVAAKLAVLRLRFSKFKATMRSDDAIANRLARMTDVELHQASSFSFYHSVCFCTTLIHQPFFSSRVTPFPDD